MNKAMNHFCLKPKKYSMVALTFLIVLFTDQHLYSQDYFEFKNPLFSFSIPLGWQEFKGKPSIPNYGKYIKLKNDTNGGILRVGQDIYIGNIETIWNLNAEEEKSN